MHSALKKPLLASALVLGLSGCTGPSPVSIATWVLDVGSFAVSGKTVTDHGLSLLAQEDCAMMKVFEGKICEAYPEYENVALATLEPLAPGSEEWAFAGVAAQSDGPLSDLRYIATQTADLVASAPMGRENGELFRSGGRELEVEAGYEESALQFAAVPQEPATLDLGGYLASD